MNFKFYLEKLGISEQFKRFMKENPDAFLCSGFFVLDKEGEDNKQHFDYYVPVTKKMFSFQLENELKLVPIETIDDKVPEKISIDYDFDFKDLEKIIVGEMQKQNVKNKIQKILLSLQSRAKETRGISDSNSLQNKTGKDFLVGTVFISGLGMLNVHINIPEMKITLFEKKSFFEMVNVLKKK